MSVSLFPWGPRIAAFALAAGLALFALDALREGPVALVVHLIPALIVCAVVAAAWRAPWFGAVAFAALAAGYAVAARERPDWIAGVSGPVLLVASLYALEWWSAHGRTGAPAGPG